MSEILNMQSTIPHPRSIVVTKQQCRNAISQAQFPLKNVFNSIEDTLAALQFHFWLASGVSCEKKDKNPNEQLNCKIFCLSVECLRIFVVILIHRKWNINSSFYARSLGTCVCASDASYSAGISNVWTCLRAFCLHSSKPKMHWPKKPPTLPKITNKLIYSSLTYYKRAATFLFCRRNVRTI